jgi:predicted aspartyl protease
MIKTLHCGTAALALVALTAPCALADPPKCHLEQIATLPVTFSQNRPLIEVSINGKPARMLVDTGSVKTLLFKDAAVAVGLNPVGTDTLFEGVGGVRAALEVTIARFGLGGSNVNNLRLFVLDGGMGKGVVGILGQDLLARADVEFDLANGAIRLFDERDCGSSNLAYWTKEPEVADMERSGAEYRLPVVLNGTTVHAMLDSGAQVSVATSTAAARVGGERATESSDGTLHGVGAKPVEVATVTFATLKVGDEEIKRAKLLVGDYFRAAREEAPTDSHIKRAMSDDDEVLLGADFLRSHRVFISHHQQRIYFTYAGGPVFQVVAPADAKPTDAK